MGTLQKLKRLVPWFYKRIKESEGTYSKDTPVCLTIEDVINALRVKISREIDKVNVTINEASGIPDYTLGMKTGAKSALRHLEWYLDNLTWAKERYDSSLEALEQEQ